MRYMGAIKRTTNNKQQPLKLKKRVKAQLTVPATNNKRRIKCTRNNHE